jgi:hypothetical protein
MNKYNYLPRPSKIKKTMPDKDKQKDFWDKLQGATTFLSTFLIGIAGILFTYFYNQRQLEQNRIQQAAQLKLDSLRLLTQVDQAGAQVQLQQVQLQTAQVQAMTQLVPYLASKDTVQRNVAYAILRSIDSTSAFIKLSNRASFGKAQLKRPDNPSQSSFGKLFVILNQIDLNRKIAINPKLPFVQRVGALDNIVKLANDKSGDRKVQDKAVSALDLVRKSPNSPLLGIGFSLADFRKYVDTLTLKGWKPSLIVLHNTGVPNLQTLPEGFEESTIVGFVKFFTEVQHWNGAPHLFIDDNKIWVINPLTRSGIHSPSWNKTSIGISMLGDYNTESIETGRGKIVQDNTVAAIAMLEKKFKISPDSLKFHSEDRLTRKVCPGKNVNKNSFIAETRR